MVDTQQKEKLWNLRCRSGYSILDCKKALIESNWDIKKAHDYLCTTDMEFGKLITKVKIS